MAAIMPNTPGTGNNIPISSYIAGITESYPNVNRQRIVESSINSKEKLDFLPVNMGINQSLSDKYLEFRINGVVGSFLDLSSLFIELQVKLVDAGTNNLLPAATTAGVVNGLSNTMFKSVSVFINEKMVEANPFFNYSSYINMLKNMDKEQVSRYGPCGHLYDDLNVLGVTSTYRAPVYASPGNIEYTLMDDIKTGGINICFPLMLDICSLDMYLLDGVDIRIRMELASQNWITNTVTANTDINLNITKAKLWIDRVTPHHNAMTALNRAINSKPLEYIFDKTLYKTYVIGTGESGIMIDQPFGNCIPEKLTMVMVSMSAMSGRKDTNPLYFRHCNLSNVHLTVNGTTIYNINTDFTNNDYSHMFYETQKSLGLDKENMITHRSYKKGRAIFCFNFVNELTEDTLPVERSANLRLSLTLSNNLATPHLVILLADTKGILSIDNQRVITCDVRG